MSPRQGLSSVSYHLRNKYLPTSQEGVVITLCIYGGARPRLSIRLRDLTQENKNMPIKAKLDPSQQYHGFQQHMEHLWKETRRKASIHFF